MIHSNKSRAGWTDPRPNFDRAAMCGLMLSLVLVGGGIATSGRLLTFLSPSGLLIVLGGTFGATLVQFSFYDLRRAWQAFIVAFFTDLSHPADRIKTMSRLGHLVRREGLLVLERQARSTDDPFLRIGLEMTADGQAAEDIRHVLETEIRTTQDRAWRAVQVFQTMGNYAPGLGLIGTLIGLIQMLGSLDRPSTIGPAMAVALITTLYGSILSNLVLLPIAGKIRNRAEEESLVKSITVEGVIALGREESPTAIEQKLQGFLPAIGG